MLAIFDSSDRSAVANVTCDYTLPGNIYAKYLAHALRHIAVACSVETVTAHTVFLIEAIRQSIHI